MPLITTYNNSSRQGFNPPDPIINNSLTVKINTQNLGSSNKNFRLRLRSGKAFNASFNNITVNWGDGIVNTYTNLSYQTVTHVYPQVGRYKIRISGDGGVQMFDASCVTELMQWGTDFRILSADNMFDNCTNMDYSATDLLTLGIPGTFNCSAVYMFNGCNRIDPDTTNWNTSACSSMTGMFRGCASFRARGIKTWDTSNVTAMNQMFSNTNLSGDYGDWIWDTGNVTNMSQMFIGTGSSWTARLSWNTSKVIGMSQMFSSSGYYFLETNAGICNWNTSSVRDMSYMFQGATSFNADISNWDTSNVIYMSNMFDGQISSITILEGIFNQPIGKWNVSSVKGMEGMFRGQKDFNQSLNEWNTINVLRMDSMFFGAISFNGAINNWNTSRVTTMENMFGGARVFNQPIGLWNTGQVSNMAGMFDANFTKYGQPMIFNQDLSLWCTTKIPVKPTNFDLDCSFWSQSKPVWGTCPVQAFIADVTLPTDSITQPLTVTLTVYADGTTPMTINWGDGTSQSVTGTNTVSKTYAAAGVYTVSITNARGYTWQTGITRIRNWGTKAINKLDFQNSKLVSVDTPTPPNLQPYGTAQVDISNAFRGCTELTGGTGLYNWSISYGTTMDNIFNGATKLNWDMSKWCVPYNYTAPTGFSTNTPLWTRSKPVWGTCANSLSLVWYDFVNPYSYPPPQTGFTAFNINTDSLYNGIVLNTIWGGASGAEANGSLAFDGAVSSVSVDGQTNLDLENTKALTFQLWVRFNNAATNQSLISKRASGFDGYMLTTNPAGSRGLTSQITIGGVTTSQNSTTNILSDNTWYFVTWIVQLNGINRLYLNTTQVMSATAPGGVYSSFARLEIGKNFITGIGQLGGRVGGFFCYPIALSVADITTNFNNTKTRYGY